MTSRKEVTLTNVLNVPEICKNLVSGSLLNSHGFQMMFESEKFIFPKSGMYVEERVYERWSMETQCNDCH